MRPTEKGISPMSATAEYERVSRWIEDEESRLRGIPVKVLRPILAREMGVSPFTLESLRKGRLKGLPGRIERAIDDALGRLCAKQQTRIEHELALAAARGRQVDGRALDRVRAHREALDRLLDEARP